MTMTGQCLCGAISYKIEGELQMCGVCHCKNCQRQAGSAYSVLFGVADDDIELSGDLASYEDHGDSGNIVYRHFCGTCGSPVKTSLPSQPGMTYIKAGTLDDSSVVDPQIHFWTRSKQAWVEIDPDVLQMSGMPG
ncbi:GFA family protein [Parasphingorhabdus flavimaris]|uniref:GFA family protein n=1 Tax=Parasphingorhabdus flavimaris TaxID=266812 RepID=A0ABX2N0A2_9SPHN|nr:GFA family protein [Parasphingorhabdus flavimaris]NVD27041.1 GFA family protein [Parasphingorhabdus flavimaris]|tara:strand:+ start:23348 stop:23752 length:405 start_codon:yes stop_codon:yes gene_type:complete